MHQTVWIFVAALIAFGCGGEGGVPSASGQEPTGADSQALSSAPLVSGPGPLNLTASWTAGQAQEFCLPLPYTAVGGDAGFSQQIVYVGAPVGRWKLHSFRFRFDGNDTKTHANCIKGCGANAAVAVGEQNLMVSQLQFPVNQNPTWSLVALAVAAEIPTELYDGTTSLVGMYPIQDGETVPVDLCVTARTESPGNMLQLWVQSTMFNQGDPFGLLTDKTDPVFSPPNGYDSSEVLWVNTSSIVLGSPLVPSNPDKNVLGWSVGVSLDSVGQYPGWPMTGWAWIQTAGGVITVTSL